MKKISLSCFVAVVALCVFSGCSPKQPEKDYTWLKQGIETAALQLKFTVAEIGDSIRLPRSIWTGYDTDFLCRQLDKKQLTGKELCRLKTHTVIWVPPVIAFPFTIGTSVFPWQSLALLINLPAMKA